MKASKFIALFWVLAGVLAGTTLATPAFDINGGVPIELTPGVPLTVNVNESGSTDIQGMMLLLEILPNPDADPFASYPPFQITNLIVDAAGSGCIFEGGTPGAHVFGQWNPFPDGSGGYTNIPPYLAFADIQIAGSLPTTGPGIAGKVTLFVPLGTPIGTVGTITTGSPTLGPSMLFNSAGASLDYAQATTALLVVPEPATLAMLALGGMVVMRRTRQRNRAAAVGRSR